RGSWGWGGWGWGWPYYAGWGWGRPWYGYSNYYDYGYPYYSDYYYPNYYGSDYYGYTYQPDYYSGTYRTPDYSNVTPAMPGGYYGYQARGAGSGADMNSALINLRVPPSAQVFFEGQPTTQTGTMRRFVSPPLAQGKEFTYDIEARWNQNGQPVTQTRHIRV